MGIGGQDGFGPLKYDTVIINRVRRMVQWV